MDEEVKDRYDWICLEFLLGRWRVEGYGGVSN